MSRQPPDFPESVRAGHEFSDVRSSYIWIFWLVMAAGAVFSFAILVWVFKSFANDFPDTFPAEEPLTVIKPTPAPQLQIHPQEEWRRFHDLQQYQLQHYGWISEEDGLVRIPVDRAMDLLLQEGFPTRAPKEEP